MNERRRPIPIPLPLAVWERDGLAAALAKAGLPTEDIQASGPLFWRFENDDVPVGFGGLEIFEDQALLRSVVTLPPVRNRGIGTGYCCLAGGGSEYSRLPRSLAGHRKSGRFFRPSRLPRLRAFGSPKSWCVRRRRSRVPQRQRR